MSSIFRFAILKSFHDGKEQIVMEYDEEIIKQRLSQLIIGNLPPFSTFKHKYSKEEIVEATNKSWDMIVLEFKKETVKLK